MEYYWEELPRPARPRAALYVWIYSVYKYIVYLLHKTKATVWSTIEKSCLGQHGLEGVGITHSTVEPVQAPQFADLGAGFGL